MVADPRDVSWVPTRGFSRLELLLFTCSAALILMGGVFLCWGETSAIRIAPGLAIFIFVVLVGAAAIIALSTWLRTPRTVGLSQKGILIAYPFRPVSFPWSDLMNVAFIGMGTVSFEPLSFNPQKQIGYQSVSIEQARAILADPRCPRVTLREEHRRLLFPN